jgi:hypothetical protein
MRSPSHPVARYATWLLGAPLAAWAVITVGLSLFGTGTVTILFIGVVAAVAMSTVIYLSGVGGWNATDEHGDYPRSQEALPNRSKRLKRAGGRGLDGGSSDFNF